MSRDEQDAIKEERERIAAWIDVRSHHLSLYPPTIGEANELERVAREIRNGARLKEATNE